MGSIAITDVAHFPHNSFGMQRSATYDYSSIPSSHRSAPLRPTYTQSPSESNYRRPLIDTHMTDVVSSRSATTATSSVHAYRTSRSEHHTPQHTSRGSLSTIPISTRPEAANHLSRPVAGDRASSMSYSGQQNPTATPANPSSTTGAPATSPNFQQTPPSPSGRIKIKSLAHIQECIADEKSPLSSSGRAALTRDGADALPQYEISDMPVTEVIEMVAGLLTKITTTNDRQHEHLHRQIPPPEGTVPLSQQTTSVLSFHGKNIPSISILSYLTRIHKYCPTTYEVFLSLLVYFDRMTDRVNSAPLRSLKAANERAMDLANDDEESGHSSVSSAVLNQEDVGTKTQTQENTPPPSGSLGRPPTVPSRQHSGIPPSPPNDAEADPHNLSHYFVVDSFNIHRLVIAGVTCASKFFSDIFYTNSRYAKVCSRYEQH